MSTMAGLLGPAYRYSWPGMLAGLLAGVVLAAVDLAMLLDSGEVPFLNQLHSLMLWTIVVVFLGSLMVHLAARIIGKQRELIQEVRELRRVLAAMAAGDAEPSPETVAAVRRLAFQVVHSD